MSKFNLLSDNVITIAQEQRNGVRLWGPFDTDLEWVKFIDVGGYCVDVRRAGKSSRRHYLECSTDILPLKIGDQLVLHGDHDSETAYNCTVLIGPAEAPKSFQYQYSLQIGTLA